MKNFDLFDLIHQAFNHICNNLAMYGFNDLIVDSRFETKFYNNIKVDADEGLLWYPDEQDMIIWAASEKIISDDQCDSYLLEVVLKIKGDI